ncbi:MAG: SDR family oxidoreductase [Synergistaceae bacterium]|nr:SDR family oxidoreductase [Synergistaceae bacterium]
MIELVSRLDGLVSNAGIVEFSPVDFITSEKLKKVFDINFSAGIELFEGLFSGDKFNDGASVVFTSSVDGNYCFTQGNAVYSASKAALNEYVRRSALKAANKNIRVNCVCPGMIETNLLRNNKSLTPEILQEDAKKYPLKRYGKPEEVAAGIIYLLSGASSYVTGTDLIIDGGISIKH